MEHQLKTRDVPPCISQVLEYKIDEDLDIEEGLCKPTDSNLFLISSMAFLQKQLKRKLCNSSVAIEEKESNVHRKYSNLLLVESGTKIKRERHFMRLPNTEKFDEVLQKEASFPARTLSIAEILPQPKTGSRRLPFPNIFKTKTSTNIFQNLISKSPKSTHSVFNIFKKSPTTKYCSEATVKEDSSLIKTNVEYSYHKSAVDYANEREFICSSSSSTTLVSPLRPSIASTEIRKNKLSNINTSNTSISRSEDDTVDLSSRSTPCISTRTKSLTQAEKNILKVIPSESIAALKESIRQKMRAPKNTSSSESSTSETTSNFVMGDDGFYIDVETGIQYKIVPRSTLGSELDSIKEQQSDLSIDNEEETESEMDICTSSHNYPYNCTDDVKTMAPSDSLEALFQQFLNCIE